MGKLGGFVAAVARRNVLGVTVLFVGMGGTFGMIGGIFDTFHRGRLKRLIGVRQILDGVFAGFRFRGEAFCANGLTGAIRTNFTGSAPSSSGWASRSSFNSGERSGKGSSCDVLRLVFM